MYMYAFGIEKGPARKPWKIRLPLLILHKDLEKSSYRVGSDAVISYNPGHIGEQE